MSDTKPERTFRTRRTPAEMARDKAAASAQMPGAEVASAAGKPLADLIATVFDPAALTASAPAPAQIDEVSADVLQEMRVRARDRKAQAAQAAAQSAAAATPLQRWLYNSNTDNISEFPEGFLIVEDGYFEYTPPANFRFRDEDKDVHLEFCRSRVNTKPIDGMANAKLIRNHSERVIAQLQYLPPQPQSMNNGALSVETSI
jgi:hypothetical protein